MNKTDKTVKKMIMINTYVEPEMRDDLNALVKVTAATQSALVRRAIAEYLAGHGYPRWAT